MFEVVSLVDHIEEVPVIATGTRWPTLREGRASDDYFLRFPECKDDPLRKDYGSVRTFPEPFARGGGFFPVDCKSRADDRIFSRADGGRKAMLRIENRFVSCRQWR